MEEGNDAGGASTPEQSLPGGGPGQHVLALGPNSATLLDLQVDGRAELMLQRAHPDDRALLERAIDTAVATLAPVACQLRMLAFDQTYRAMTLRLSTSLGKVYARVLALANDGPADDPVARVIGAQQRSEARLFLASLATRDIVWDWDIVHDSYYFSPRLGELLGYSSKKPLLDAEGFAALIHPEDLPGERDARRRHLETNARYDVDYRLRDTAGAYRWFRAVGETVRDPDGTALHMAGTIGDVDALRFAERQLIEQRDQLRETTIKLQDVSLRLINSQEDERRHIARELHDQTGQTLTAAILDLEYWRGKSIPPEEVDRVLGEVKRALAEIRDISLQLRPPMLSEGGLESALQYYLNRQAAAGKFEVSFTAEGRKERLRPEVEITAFRLVQEAVNNIIRHAKARHVDVSLKTSRPDLVIRISDDGSGFVANEAVSNAVGGTSLGLISMGERAALVRGRCEFISTPGVGSIVLARIPLD